MTPDPLIIRRSVAETVQWPPVAVDAPVAPSRSQRHHMFYRKGGSSLLLPVQIYHEHKMLDTSFMAAIN